MNGCLKVVWKQSLHPLGYDIVPLQFIQSLDAGVQAASGCLEHFDWILGDRLPIPRLSSNLTATTPILALQPESASGQMLERMQLTESRKKSINCAAGCAKAGRDI